MHPVVCYLRKDTIWESRTTNNRKETKYTLLCQLLFLFVFGGIATCFDPFSGSSSGVRQYYLASDRLVSILFLSDYLLCNCSKLYLFGYT
jgi:hypothetical protein